MNIFTMSPAELARQIETGDGDAIKKILSEGNTQPSSVVRSSGATYILNVGTMTDD